MIEQYNYRLTVESKIKEVENENRVNKDEKQKFEIEYRVLLDKFNDLKKNYEQCENELNYTKNKQNEEVNIIEAKFDKMMKEIEYLQKENNSLRSNEEKNRSEIFNLEKQRDNYREKYQDYKNKNTILNSKIVEVSDCS